MAMVRSQNLVLLTGRVGTIYDRRELPNHKPGPLNISIATQEAYRDNKQRSDWHKVTFWGVLADSIEKFIVVGSLVAIEGALRTVQKRNADGSLSSYVNVEGHHLTLLVKSPRDKEGSGGDDEEPADDAEPEDDSGQEKDPDDVIPF
ncbi:MAG: single-stranded DNA-binding protein [Candidatus Aminicenantes bacterium]|nr:single-stranded DNA-binding protein [Candidatus Aminicenantes bacterium]